MRATWRIGLPFAAAALCLAGTQLAGPVVTWVLLLVATGPTACEAGDAVSVPLISCASSIASSGLGGVPFLTERRPSIARMPTRTNRTTLTIR